MFFWLFWHQNHACNVTSCKVLSVLQSKFVCEAQNRQKSPKWENFKFQDFFKTEDASWWNWKRFSDLSRLLRISLIIYSTFLAQLFYFQTCKVLPFFNLRNDVKIAKNQNFQKVVTFLFLKLQSWFWYQITQNDEYNPLTI